MSLEGLGTVAFLGGVGATLYNFLLTKEELVFYTLLMEPKDLQVSLNGRCA